MVVEILITGLCAFVRESCAMGNAKAMHVVMLKGRESHAPRLLIDSDNVQPPAAGDSQEVKNGRVLEEVFDLPDGNQYFMWDLTGVRFEIVGAPAIGIVEGGRDASSSKPNDDPHGKKDQPDDFSWVPELHKTCGVTVDRAKAKPVFLDDTKLAPEAVARMMKLDVEPTATAKKNWLEAEYHITMDNQPVFVFGATGYKQVLADGAKLTMEITSLPVRLRLVGYKDGFTREIILKAPTSGPGSKLIKIALSNMPRTQEAADPEIKHFVAYKDLLLKDPGTCVLPKEEGSQDQRAHHVSPVKCTICSSCGYE